MQSKRKQAMMQSRFERVRGIHFIGIGGSGMCGIAEILHRLEFTVTGSDANESANTLRLKNMGIKVHMGHAPEHVAGADAVVVSSAINESNVEVIEARARHLPLVPRAVMLGELMRYRAGIAIAGTHGKTTTTSMLATIFAQAGLDPTYVIGGQLRSIGSNAYLGKGSHLITEADESDASFIHLQPDISVVTNIEQDHMNHYGNDPEKLHAIFLQFLHNLPFYGLAVLCADDAVVQKLIPQLARPKVTYGFSESADYRLSDYRQEGVSCAFSLHCPGGDRLEIDLCTPGRHNALNAAACITIARDIDIPDQAICKALAGFSGVSRRFEVLGNYHAPGKKKLAPPVTLIDDYGHHPTELGCTIQAARDAWPNRRLVVLFQPHRFSRTRELFDEFVQTLIKPDVLILMETYPAGEKSIPGFESKHLATNVRALGKSEVFLASNLEKLQSMLHDVLKPDDLLLTQGAGTVGQVAAALAASSLARVEKA